MMKAGRQGGRNSQFSGWHACWCNGWRGLDGAGEVSCDRAWEYGFPTICPGMPALGHAIAWHGLPWQMVEPH